MGVNTTGLLNTQTEVYASYKNDAVTKNETAAMRHQGLKINSGFCSGSTIFSALCCCNWTDTDCGWS